MPTERIPAKDREYSPHMIKILTERILPNCSEKGKEAFSKWWNQGEPITGFIEAEYTETDQEGNELTWQIKDGNQYVHIQPPSIVTGKPWFHHLLKASLPFSEQLGRIRSVRILIMWGE